MKMTTRIEPLEPLVCFHYGVKGHDKGEVKLQPRAPLSTTHITWLTAVIYTCTNPCRTIQHQCNGHQTLLSPKIIRNSFVLFHFKGSSFIFRMNE